MKEFHGNGAIRTSGTIASKYNNFFAFKKSPPINNKSFLPSLSTVNELINNLACLDLKESQVIH